jgi:tetratricopeptide (TPR) repeat protein
MYEYIKKRLIKELISEISCLGAAELELIGHNVVGIRENSRMIHHGINKDYKPVKLTVDSFSEDSLIVAEYSTEQGYFEDQGSASENKFSSFRKIEKDIQHALDHLKPQGPEKIYLITNQEEPPFFRAKFNATPLYQSHGGKLVFMDARELAKEVYQQSKNNPDCAAFYKQYFPGFSQNLDNYEYYGKLPAPCDGYIQDKGIHDALAKYFETNSVCVLHGVSGSGKTQAAINFAHPSSNGFENYVWISGEDWPKGSSLSAIQRSRGGAPVNIVGLFNISKTILVIDGLERSINQIDFNELQDGFNKGGVVLVTSQSAILESGNSLQIPEISDITASRILGEDWGNSSIEAQRFIRACKFSPLILSTARSIIENERVASVDLYKEVLKSPNDIAGRDGQSIMEKILNRLGSRTLMALKKIANSGLTVHDLDFLRFFIGINNAYKLQQLSILLSTNTPGVTKIHDLVAHAICEFFDGKELADAVEKYVRKYYGEMTPSVLRQIHLAFHSLQAEHVRRGDRDCDWLTYALLQAEGEEKLVLQQKIYLLEISPSLSLPFIMCLIDAKEAYAYTIENINEREKYYRQCADQFEKTFNAINDEDLKAELLHHRGKALRRCGDYREALDCFNQLLKMKPEWHATHGQIAHLGMQDGVDKYIKEAGERSMRVLIYEIIQDASSVPLRVSLAALAMLRSYQNVVKELSEDSNKVQKLSDVISLSALDGFGQFYEAFVSFTSKFGYIHPSICVNLADRLPEMLAIPPESVEKKHRVSACEALSNTAISAAKEGKQTIFDRLVNLSVQFADVIFSNDELKPFDGRAIAKAYITANLPKKALEAISKVPADRIDHWLLYRKAEAEIMVGENDGYARALESALNAIDLANKDTKAMPHISSYHKLLSEVYERRGQIDEAIKEIESAISKCQNDQFEYELTSRISILKSLLK